MVTYAPMDSAKCDRMGPTFRTTRMGGEDIVYPKLAGSEFTLKARFASSIWSQDRLVTSRTSLICRHSPLPFKSAR